MVPDGSGQRVPKRAKGKPPLKRGGIQGRTYGFPSQESCFRSWLSPGWGDGSVDGGLAM